MKTRSLLSLAIALALALAGAAHAELFKWVDENGKTHYGDRVPDRYQKQQKALKVEKAPSQADRDAAVQRLQKERSAVEALKAQRDAKAQTAGKPVKPAASGPANETACQKEWRLFLDAKTCFQPFRTATGGIRAEAYEHCKEVAEPRSVCPP